MTRPWLMIGSVLIAAASCGVDDPEATSHSASVPIEQALTTPRGFALDRSSGGGVMIFHGTGTYAPDWVTVVDLHRALVRNLTGNFRGAPAAHFTRQSITKFWQAAAAGNNDNLTAKVVVNGTFFNDKANPTTIAFGVKAHGQVLSYGYGAHVEFRGHVRTLSIDARGRPTIAPYADHTFNSPVPDVIGALDTVADKGAGTAKFRTFAGVRDQRGKGVPDTLVIVSSSSAKQAHVRDVLTLFGVPKLQDQIMLDGGTSTGMVADGKIRVSAGGIVPHAIAIYAGASCAFYCGDYGYADNQCVGGWQCRWPCIAYTACR